MSSLKEKVEALLEDFEKGENDDAAFTKSYTESLAFIQLIYLEKSTQFESASEAVKSYQQSGKSSETRLNLKTVFYEILTGLFFSKPVKPRG